MEKVLFMFNLTEVNTFIIINMQHTTEQLQEVRGVNTKSIVFITATLVKNMYNENSQREGKSRPGLTDIKIFDEHGVGTPLNTDQGSDILRDFYFDNPDTIIHFDDEGDFGKYSNKQIKEGSVKDEGDFGREIIDVAYYNPKQITPERLSLALANLKQQKPE